MIADARFGPALRGVRPLAFTPRASIPLATACLVANGLREILREVLAARCELAIGEPAAIGAGGWAALAADAYLYLTRGRQTDIVLVLPRRDARRLVRCAFGEADAPAGGDCSTLELAAVERIAARCASTFDPLCAERLGAPRAIALHEVPPCVAYFDVRVQQPLPLSFGVGIVRELPDAGASGGLSAALLAPVGLRLQAIVAEGTIDAAALAALRTGGIVPLATRLPQPARLLASGRTIAVGECGTHDGHVAFRVAALTGAAS